MATEQSTATDEHDRLERKMKRAKREADYLEDEIARESDNDKKRRKLSDMEDLQARLGGSSGN